MKISGSNLNAVYSRRTNNINSGKIKKSGFESVLNAGPKDSVTISGGKNMSDDEFVSSLSRKLSADVKAGTSDDDLKDIKKQIAFGTYDINVNEIAKKILF